ncbi:M23 family metallopeptidase [Streptomyces sp. NPDC001941]|uniref:M23 family metallopeptidase n=1 Tax=Streptomyces sp. NPDC001941 TaxID=3154659 RepID=UPI00332EEB1B
MNDQPPRAGYTAGNDGYSTGSFATDPLFGSAPNGFPADQSGQYESSPWSDTATAQWDTGGYDTTGAFAAAPPYEATAQWDSGAWSQVDQTGSSPLQTQQFQPGQFAQFAQPTQATHTTQFPQFTDGQFDATGRFDTTGQFDTAGHFDTTGQFDGAQFQQAGQTQEFQQLQEFQDLQQFHDVRTGQFDTTGQFDATGQFDTTGQFPAATAQWDTGAYDTGQWTTPGFAGETGAYDATQWNHAEPGPAGPVVPEQYAPDHGHEDLSLHEQATQTFQVPDDLAGHAGSEQYEGGEDGEDDGEGDDAPHAGRTPAPGRPVSRRAGTRRRSPAKRSALLTVAVPSVCVLGAAGIAAASVTGGAEKKDDTTTMAAADPSSVKPVAANNQLDTQLAALSADARDFGDRASRTQERLDLKARQEADKKKREAEAARKEALRPKFALPVKLHQLSAYYGQAGVNWLSVHTGIDFPVQTGTPVMSATDGTVRTQWNSAYGNMAIVTAPDGTETWYCHLSSTKIRSGEVKAGDVIAYSGDSGNSTGPHLHFEVRPGGGSAIDPLPWLRSHGLDPTS